MKTIALLHGTSAENEPTISPAEPIPDDAIKVVCDGETYTVYQPGDTLPKDEA